jgi:hypothetical protein
MSDVFAFGVLLYEIFALSPPWRDMQNFVAASDVLQGKRMTLDVTIPAALRALMNDCWLDKASKVR